MDVILLFGGQQHVSVTRGCLQGGENKNKNINKICINDSTVGKII